MPLVTKVAAFWPRVADIGATRRPVAGRGRHEMRTGLAATSETFNHTLLVCQIELRLQHTPQQVIAAIKLRRRRLKRSLRASGNLRGNSSRCYAMLARNCRFLVPAFALANQTLPARRRAVAVSPAIRAQVGAAVAPQLLDRRQPQLASTCMAEIVKSMCHRRRSSPSFPGLLPRAANWALTNRTSVRFECSKRLVGCQRPNCMT